jgi:hypothetical protein
VKTRVNSIQLPEVVQTVNRVEGGVREWAVEGARQGRRVREGVGGRRVGNKESRIVKE